MSKPFDEPHLTGAEEWTLEAGVSHLSDAARSAAADGQDAVLSELALAHLEACSECAVAVAALASGSVDLSFALHSAYARTADAHHASATPGASPQTIAARRPEPQSPRFPVAAVVVALALAAAGTTPAIVGHDATAAISTLADVVRAAIAVAEVPRSSAVNVVLELAAASMLAALGFLVARGASTAPSKGVVR